MNIKWYKTISGSEYVIDFEKKTWWRKRGQNANVLRTDEGEFITIEFKFVLVDDKNESIVMTCPPINPESDLRLIVSTQIIEERTLDAESSVH